MDEILVRSTIHLPGLGQNQEAIVDPSVPYVAMCLEQGFVVPVQPEAEHPETASEKEETE